MGQMGKYPRDGTAKNKDKEIHLTVSEIHCIWVKWATMGNYKHVKWAKGHDAVQLQIETIP